MINRSVHSHDAGDVVRSLYLDLLQVGVSMPRAVHQYGFLVFAHFLDKVNRSMFKSALLGGIDRCEHLLYLANGTWPTPFSLVPLALRLVAAIARTSFAGGTSIWESTPGNLGETHVKAVGARSEPAKRHGKVLFDSFDLSPSYCLDRSHGES